MFTKQTIRDIDLKDKTVLLRADYNLPLQDGVISDDYRLQQSLPTVRYLLKHAKKLVICSHLGRPNGVQNASLSLNPVAQRLHELTGHEVLLLADRIGKNAETAVAKLRPGQIGLLENLRFYPEEEANDRGFAKQLANVADVFVEDGFGVVHRSHASTEGVTHFLPSVAGFLLEKEVDAITTVMQQPKRPLLAVIGGAKIADKIDLLEKFMKFADIIAIGGAMANTFLKAQGIDVAASLVDDDELSIAKDILRRAAAEAASRDFVFYIPQDGVVAHKIDAHSATRIVDWSAHVIADIENYPKRPPAASGHIGDHEMILDIGPFSGAFIAGAVQLAGTVVWNGTLGVTEITGQRGPVGPFAHGTDLLMEAMLGQFGHRPFSLIGGGDTVGYVSERGLLGAFDHVSTGGGASLELMAGRTLPGLAALLDKKL